MSMYGLLVDKDKYDQLIKLKRELQEELVSKGFDTDDVCDFIDSAW